MSLEKESLRKYSKLFCKIGLGPNYRHLISDLAKTEMGRNALYKEGLRQKGIIGWQNLLEENINFKINTILDVGAGSLEFAEACLKVFKCSCDVVEPNFYRYDTEYLRFFYDKPEDINLIESPWQEVAKVQKEYNLIIKTYNPWVSWIEIFEKTKAQRIISNSDHVDGLKDLGFKKEKILKQYYFEDKEIGDISLYQR